MIAGSFELPKSPLHIENAPSLISLLKTFILFCISYVSKDVGLPINKSCLLFFGNEKSIAVTSRFRLRTLLGSLFNLEVN